jgi:hypothetical protein
MEPTRIPDAADRAAAAPGAALGTWVRRTSRSAAWAPIAVFLVHGVLSRAGLDLYDALPDTDVPMHFLGGVAITHFETHAAVHARDVGLLGSPSRATLLALVLACTASAAVTWEFAEWGADALFHAGAQKGLDDTMGDMALGIAGGLAYLAVRRFRLPAAGSSA